MGWVDRNEVLFILGQVCWGQQTLRTAYCLHGTFCLVLKDYCGKSISCCPSWDWSRFPVYPRFAGPRRLPGRKRSLQSEVECVAADAKSKQLQPGTKGLQKSGSGAERAELTLQRQCEVPSLASHICVCAGYQVPGLQRAPRLTSRPSPTHDCTYSWANESWRSRVAQGEK